MAFVQTWKAPEDKVIVEIIPEVRKTPTGILLPDQVGNKVKRGIVLAAGPEAKGVQVGYEVIFLSGREVEIGTTQGKTIVSLSVSYIMAALKESFE